MQFTSILFAALGTTTTLACGGPDCCYRNMKACFVHSKAIEIVSLGIICTGVNFCGWSTKRFCNADCCRPVKGRIKSYGVKC